MGIKDLYNMVELANNILSTSCRTHCMCIIY